MSGRRVRHWLALGACALAALLAAAELSAQEVRVRDLIIPDAAPPVRLMGYGLVTGLNNTGDRVTGAAGSRQTVQSVVNLLRRFDVEVPLDLLRTRNVAAVLVTAEVSPFLRPGGRFAVRVSSVGDATSLRGGVLWMTPLLNDAGQRAVAGAQGALVMSEGGASADNLPVLTTARVPDGGIVEAELARPDFRSVTKLLLRDPDVATASRIAAAVDSAFGAPGTAVVDDPGAITLTLKDTIGGLVATIAKVRELRVRSDRPARIIIDSRDGTVVTGGELIVNAAVVSHAGITLTIGTVADTATLRGDVRLPSGTTVQRIAAALHAAQSTATEVAAIFDALREAGALAAEILVR
ncbi:MAG: flagellar basal body P-ring protein FlgI [Gemmatimonadaceae bacterium]|nr:flagellar basal body P-ring protein FlgI [Gemmatimonadaceae bacterium]